MPFTITASVGDKGSNKPNDVRLIQMLLNRVPSFRGGPNPKLVPDADAGPSTIGAIKGFQEHHGLLPKDGRIDPGFPTLDRLNEVLVMPPADLVAVEGLPDPGVPLAPGSGGQSIGIEALQPGDLIVTASEGAVSWAIRKVTSSAVSHVMLYLGPDELGAVRVAEAVTPKLRFAFLTGVGGAALSLDDVTHAFHDATMAVAFRPQPRLRQEQASSIVFSAVSQIGKPYGRIGAALQPVVSLDLGTWCESLGASGAEAAAIVEHVGTKLQDAVDPLPLDVDSLFEGMADNISTASRDIAKRCLRWAGQVQFNKLNKDFDQSMFCSEFILSTYQAAGVPLTSTPPQWDSPQDIVELSWSGRLGYVGHLI